jgi:hypothetical protein
MRHLLVKQHALQHGDLLVLCRRSRAIHLADVDTCQVFLHCRRPTSGPGSTTCGVAPGWCWCMCVPWRWPWQ